MKLYTVEQMRDAIKMARNGARSEDNIIGSLNFIKPYIELPSDEEIEEKLNVAYGNGYEQGEMDFYKKMQEKGNEYADGYAEGYKRALELTKWTISNLIPPHNEQ